MASPRDSLALGFLLLVLCLSHGSCSVLARKIISDEVILNESKRQLWESPPRPQLVPGAAPAPPPKGGLVPELIKEDSTKSLEASHETAPPTSLGDVQAACGCPLCKPRALVPNCPNNCGPAYIPPQPIPGCQPAASPQPGPLYPPQPEPQYPPQPEPQYPPQPEPQYPPQPEPHYPPQPEPQYPPQPEPQYPPQPEPMYPPQPEPQYPPQPEPQYPPQPEPQYPPQPCTGCQPASPPQVKPGCKPAYPIPDPAYPPQPEPNNPPQPEPTYPPWPLPAYPPQPEPFYPPQPEPTCFPTEGRQCPGSSSDTQNSLLAWDNGSLPPDEVPVETLNEKDGRSMNGHGSTSLNEILRESLNEKEDGKFTNGHGSPLPNVILEEPLNEMEDGRSTNGHGIPHPNAILGEPLDEKEDGGSIKKQHFHDDPKPPTQNSFLSSKKKELQLLPSPDDRI